MNRKVYFTVNNLLVDFLLENAFTVNAEKGFTMFFVADSVDNFQLKFYVLVFRFKLMSVRWFELAQVYCP
jgi:hypothetical protein